MSLYWRHHLAERLPELEALEECLSSGARMRKHHVVCGLGMAANKHRIHAHVQMDRNGLGLTAVAAFPSYCAAMQGAFRRNSKRAPIDQEAEREVDAQEEMRGRMVEHGD